MKKLAWLLALVSGCASQGGGGAPTQEERDSEMSSILAMAYDPAQLRVGQRAIYSVMRQGEGSPRYVQLQVVAQDGDTMWVELKLPIDPRPMVVKSRLDRAGKLHEQWVGEPGSTGPAKTYPRPDGKPVEPPRAGDSRADVSVADETVTVGGRQYACKKVTTKLTYGGGKQSVMINWCHPEVPFSFKLGADSLGGVVKRVYGRYAMELTVASQTGARSELEIPRK